MTLSRRYMEMIGVFEVEVVDPDTARSYTSVNGKSTHCFWPNTVV